MSDDRSKCGSCSVGSGVKKGGASLNLSRVADGVKQESEQPDSAQ